MKSAIPSSDSDSEYVVVTMEDEEEIKAREKMHKTMNEISKIIMPHQHIIDDGIFGENDISALLFSNPNAQKYWPTVQLCLLSQSSQEQQTIDYYKSLFYDMMHKYITHATSVGHILPYVDIANHKNIIDITKYHDRSTSKHKTTDLDIVFYEDEIDTMRAHGWKIFIPCFDDMVVRVNRKQYLHIITESLDLNKNEIIISLKDYIGDKCDWSCAFSAKIKLSFLDESDQGLPCKWEVLDAESYESFVLRYVDDLKWTKEQKRLWFDVLGVNEASSLTLVKCVFAGMTNKSVTTTLNNFADLQKLQKLNLPHAKFTIISQGNDVLVHHNRETAQKAFLRYNKIITFINTILYGVTDTIKDDEISDDIPEYIQSRNLIISADGTKRIDKMIIKSNINPLDNINAHAHKT